MRGGMKNAEADSGRTAGKERGSWRIKHTHALARKHTLIYLSLAASVVVVVVVVAASAWKRGSERER